jgi:hypothetical protein
MADFIDVMDQRIFTRFPVGINGRFFSNEQKTGWKECTILDVSRKGMLITYPASEKMSPGTTVCLEIYIPNQLDPVSAKGTVRWVKQNQDIIISGIELSKLLEKDILCKLG